MTGRILSGNILSGSVTFPRLRSSPVSGSVPPAFSFEGPKRLGLSVFCDVRVGEAERGLVAMDRNGVAAPDAYGDRERPVVHRVALQAKHLGSPVRMCSRL